MLIRPGSRVADRFEVVREEKEAPAYRCVRAVDRQDDGEVELWIVKTVLLPGPAERAAFVKEANAARALSHSAVRRVLGAGEHAVGCWVALAAAAGITLAERVRARRPAADGEGYRRAQAVGPPLATRPP